MFAEHCRRCGLPTPTIFLELEAGRIIAREWTEPGLPPVDLIIKRKVGKGGRQMMRWEFMGNAGYRSATGDVLDAPTLLERLKSESVDQHLLVVRRLRNHPEIADMAGKNAEVLTTARVVTGLDENGDPEVLSSTFKIAVNQTVADNVHFGGLAAPVNIETGILGPGISTIPLKTAVDHHPTSGGRITGRRLPMWNEVCRLVKRAHDTLPNPLFVGWDVGLTTEGPVLIEGNIGTCLHLQQTPHGEPLSAQRFGQLFAYHLDRIDPNTANYNKPAPQFREPEEDADADER